MTLSVSRRSLLALGAGLGTSAMLGDAALSKAPQLGTQAPGYYRFKVGDAEVSVSAALAPSRPCSSPWDLSLSRPLS